MVEWTWYKVVKADASNSPREPFILWNSGIGLLLALPPGARVPEGWAVEKWREPPARPAVLAHAAEFGERALGAALVAPLPLREAMELYSRFVSEYEGARRAAQLGETRAMRRLAAELELWEEFPKTMAVYAYRAVRFLSLDEEVKVGLLKKAKLRDLAEAARKGDEGARKAIRKLSKPAEELKGAEPRGLERLMAQSQLEKLVRALSVVYREPYGCEVFVARDFSFSVARGRNCNFLAVGEPRTGKSTLIASMLVQLAADPWSRLEVANVLVLDWTGEYAFLSKRGFKVVSALAPIANPLALGPKAALSVLEEAAYEYFAQERARLSPIVAEQAERALVDALATGGTLVDVARSLRKMAERAGGEDERVAALAAARRVAPLVHPALCAKETALPTGRVVVDLSPLPDSRVKRAVALTLLRAVFEAYGGWRGLIVVDEVHNYMVPTGWGYDCPVITAIANQLQKYGVWLWVAGQQYHLVPAGMQGSRAIAVFRQTHAEALRAIGLSMGAEAAETARSLPSRQFYLYADCSVPAVRAMPPKAESVAREMQLARGFSQRVDFSEVAAKYSIDYLDLVEAYVRCLPHARAIVSFAERRASLEEVEAVKRLSLDGKMVRALSELYWLLPGTGA